MASFRAQLRDTYSVQTRKIFTPLKASHSYIIIFFPNIDVFFLRIRRFRLSLWFMTAYQYHYLDGDDFQSQIMRFFDTLSARLIIVRDLTLLNGVKFIVSITRATVNHSTHVCEFQYSNQSSYHAKCTGRFRADAFTGKNFSQTLGTRIYAIIVKTTF